MATGFIKAGEPIRLDAALPPEEFRFIADMKYEVISFPAIFSEMVGGQVKPGHKINVYGYRKGDGEDDYGDLTLIASNVIVVDVRTATGEDAGPQPAQTQSPSTSSALGLGSVTSGAFGTQPASVVTVAAEPKVAQNIIATLGGKAYAAWVTLAPDPSIIVTPEPIVQPTSELSTPGQTATAQPEQTPAVSPSAISGSVYMSKSHGGEKSSYAVNLTKVIYAHVELKYTPSDVPMPIRIEVVQGQTVLHTWSFTHPKSGIEWYTLDYEDGFPADSSFTTTVHAGTIAFSVDWKTNAEGIDYTGGDTSASSNRLPNTGGNSTTDGN